MLILEFPEEMWLSAKSFEVGIGRSLDVEITESSVSGREKTTRYILPRHRDNRLGNMLVR